jgi:transcriptional regulator with XRE-family HTH domain
MARTRLGLTQEQVARAVGFVPIVYGRIERGDMLPSVPKLRQLCVTLGVSADTLLSANRPPGVPLLKKDFATDEPPEVRRFAILLSDLPPDKLQVFHDYVLALSKK